MSGNIKKAAIRLAEKMQRVSTLLKSTGSTYLRLPFLSSSKAAKSEEIESCYTKLDTNFEDTKIAFRSKTNFDLLRGLIVLRLCTYDTLVKNNASLLKWTRKVFGKTIFRASMRAGFYGHFVAGESVEEVLPRIQKMRKYGVKAILDYSVENDMTEQEAAEAEKQALLDKPEPEYINPDIDVNPNGTLQGPGFPQVHLGPEKVYMQQYQPQEDFMDRRSGVMSARTYFYSGEPECDKNCEIFLNCIDEVSKATEGVGLAAVKLTALGRPQLLLQLSEVIAQTRQFYKVLTGSTWENLVHAQLTESDFMEKLEKFGIKTESSEVKAWFDQADFDKNGFVDLYEWGRLLDHDFKLSKMFQVLNLKTGKLDSLMSNLTDEEEVQFRNMMNRMQVIADRAVEKGVRVMVDAEQTYFQPAISRLTLELIRKYNKEHAVIFNTFQCYLKHALTNVRIDLHICRRENLSFGAKLVRGAYMEQERQRAAEIGYEDPILPNYDATSQMYDDVVAEVVNEAKQRPVGTVSVMCATHNENAVRNIVDRMRDAGISPSDRVLCFGQLYGMCDHVSYSLGQAGYSVYKYVPYGPIEEVMPYLARRAQENGGNVLSTAAKERKLMRKELKRRLLGVSG